MLKTYWWRTAGKDPNLGDELTPILLKALFAVEPTHTTMWDADLVSTGSLLNFCFGRRFHLRRRPLGIVGSGFMAAPRIVAVPRCAKIYSVRGHLSHQLIGSREAVTLGDPGLLVARLFPAASGFSKKYDFGLIPHHSRPGAFDQWNKYLSRRKATVISFSTADLEDVVKKIRECNVIISQALHGLIIADSLNVPSVWLDDGALHTGGRFKFYDYFSSVGRNFNKSIKMKEVTDDRKIEDSIHYPDARRISSLQEDILDAFRRFLADLALKQ